MTPMNELSAEQFALKWNNYSNNLSLGFSSYLNSKNLVDVTLAVEGQLVQAHKLVLSICSPYFQDIFKNNPCQHPVVILRDMKYTEIDALLKFMYQGEVNVKHEELANFLKVAETLKIKGLTLENNPDRNSSNDNNNSKSSEQYSNGTLENEEIFDKADFSGSIQRGTSHNKRSKDFTSTRSVKKTKKSLIITDHEVSSKMILKAAIENNDPTKENALHPNENLINVNEYQNKTEKNDDSSIDLTKDEEVSDGDDKVLTNALNQPLEQQSNIIGSVVTYRLSSRGRPQLVHDGYVYNLTSRSEVLNRSHYRCAKQHRGCRGKCAVIAEQFMPTGVHDHNHAPGYQSEKDYRKKKSTETE